MIGGLGAEIALDIAESYDDIGADVTILRDGTEVADVRAHIKQDIVSPMVPNYRGAYLGSSFIIRAFFPVTTAVIPGDVVVISRIKYLVIARLASEFMDGSKLELSFILYMVNFEGRVFRLSKTRNTDTMELGFTETEMVAPAYGYYGVKEDRLEVQDMGALNISRGVLYMPQHYAVQPLDRLTWGDRTYMAGSVDNLFYENISIIEMTEDTRKIVGTPVYASRIKDAGELR